MLPVLIGVGVAMGAVALFASKSAADKRSEAFAHDLARAEEQVRNACAAAAARAEAERWAAEVCARNDLRVAKERYQTLMGIILQVDAALQGGGVSVAERLQLHGKRSALWAEAEALVRRWPAVAVG